MHIHSKAFQELQKNIDVGSKYIWGLTFDIYRFSGIQVFLQAISGGSSLIITESNYSMKEIVDLFVKKSCNIISATPSFLEKSFNDKRIRTI